MPVYTVFVAASLVTKWFWMMLCLTFYAAGASDRYAVPRALPHVFADFPVSKYLYRTEEDPPDKAYKEYMERTKDRRARLQKVGGAGLAAFLKKDQQVNE